MIEIGYNLAMIILIGLVCITFLMAFSYLLGKYYEKYKFAKTKRCEE